MTLYTIHEPSSYWSVKSTVVCAYRAEEAQQAKGRSKKHASALIPKHGNNAAEEP